MNKKKGFTLAELLIVVAIIAVLVGVAIPVFTSQLEKSREAVDLSNIRAAYAECTTAVLTGEPTDPSVTPGTGTDSGSFSKTVPLKQTKKDWTGDNRDAVIGDVKMSSLTITDNPSDIVVKVDKDGIAEIGGVKAGAGGAGAGGAGGAGAGGVTP